MSKVKCNLIPHIRPRSAPIGIFPWAGGIVMSLFELTRTLSICGMSSAEEGSDLQGQWQPVKQGQANMNLNEPPPSPSEFSFNLFWMVQDGWSLTIPPDRYAL